MEKSRRGAASEVRRVQTSQTGDFIPPMRYPRRDAPETLTRRDAAEE